MQLNKSIKIPCTIKENKETSIFAQTKLFFLIYGPKIWLAVSEYRRKLLNSQNNGKWQLFYNKGCHDHLKRLLEKNSYLFFIKIFINCMNYWVSKKNKFNFLEIYFCSSSKMLIVIILLSATLNLLHGKNLFSIASSLPIVFKFSYGHHSKAFQHFLIFMTTPSIP